MRNPFITSLLLIPLSVMPVGSAHATDWQAHPEDFFTITVVDDATSRGVPLVEISTRNAVVFHTDSNGVVAIGDPGLMNQKVFFGVSSHGYEYAARGFLGRGEVLEVKPGGGVTLRVHRRNIAERLYRITGEGIYRDSVLAGKPVPTKAPVLSGKVTGQDTVIAAVYRDKIYWCWGDTIGLASMNLSASGATSELPGKGGLDPSVGVDLSYFVDDSGFSKAMCPYDSPGLKWIEGLFTIRDEKGEERLMTRCPSMRGMGPANEWCLLMFDDKKQAFEPVVRWKYTVGHRSAHPFHAMVDGKEYIYIFPFLRVLADFAHLKNLKQYEFFTPLTPGTRYDKENPKLERDANGRLVYGWKADTDALDEGRQRELARAGKIKPEECWFTPRDIDSGETVDIRIGSVCWNQFVKRWALIAERTPGDIWYAEGDTPTGPWVYAKRIVSHNRYSFYNPTQHDFFDQEGGRRIYFEGTYTDLWSDAPAKTPHYDYNQIMYRLTLDDPRLLLPVPVYRVEAANGKPRYMLRDAVAAGNLWEHVREAAFFALPPERSAPDTVAIYAEQKGKSDVLKAHAPALRFGLAHPLFRALPTETKGSAEPFAGEWLCKAKTDTGLENEFPIQLEQKGNRVTLLGRRADAKPTSATLRDGQLEISIRRRGSFRFTLHLRLEQGKLKGTWEQLDGPMNGTVEGTRQEEMTADNFVRLQAASPATALLYEYRRGDGATIYSTDGELSDPARSRSAKPLCRVWKTPAPTPQLDWKTCPAPVALAKKP